ncbi:MAG: phosphoribosylformylglycinamidine synthase, partial [Bacteroidales bacterium]|nr:phosphoribosylformylglycinamidine synthase [Bacteroidales bacterium]
MILFFQSKLQTVIAAGTQRKLRKNEMARLIWLFGDAVFLEKDNLDGIFTGPRKEMITPWSTNAVEMTQNMGIEGIDRIEEFHSVQGKKPSWDPMLQQLYNGLDQDLYKIDRQAEPLIYIDNIAAYNTSEGLALSNEEVRYLEELSKKIGRKLTDSEVFGFSQVNSEHCRHKIFNGV